MSVPEPPVRVEATDARSFAGGPVTLVRAVVEEVTAHDGAAPLDEAALLELQHGLGDTAMWTAGSQGFAWRHAGGLEVVVRPAARGQGLGTALTGVATSAPGGLTAWSHVDDPAAAALARRFGFQRVRDLWVMRRALSDLPPAPAADPHVTVRTFQVDRDEDAWVALNAAAFAHHPEQGSLTRADLDERMAQPWFDPAGFFLVERGGQLVGFHWTKVHDERPPFGEVYVLGVSPTAQGGGLGKLLTRVGLAHLAGLGLAEVILYVEADNAPAIAVYSRLGFSHAPADTHVQYARSH